MNHTCTDLTCFQFCIEKGGYLAEIKSSEEQNQLQQIYGEKASGYWIGLSDLEQEGHFQWQQSMTPLEWSNWLGKGDICFFGMPSRENEPNNGFGMDHCVVVKPRCSWKWNDEQCEPSRSFFDAMWNSHYALFEENY